MEALEKRLQDGFQKIGEAMNQGVSVTNWEKHWIELLRQYEALSDAVNAKQAAAPLQQSEMPGLPRPERAA
jgi:hypothetical protein